MTIAIGDKVKLRFDTLNIDNTNNIYEVVTVKSNSPSGSAFWEVSDSGDLFILDCPVILIKVDGALP